MLKFCKHCNAEFDINDENHWYKQPNKTCKLGFQLTCRPHKKEYKRRWYEENKISENEVSKHWAKNHKEHMKQLGKNWREKNPEYNKNWREKNSKQVKQNYKHWYENNKAHKQEYERERLKTNINYKLGRILRSRLGNVLKRKSKIGSAVKDLGCSIEFLKQYLESKFQPGMSWDNWGINGWHIDHIIPLSKFDLTDREQFLEACHYTNLQPLWSTDNLKKGSKYEKNN